MLLSLCGLAAASAAQAEMPWDPFIVGCMEAGNNRAECFEQLPPDLLAALEAYEAQQRELRRAQAHLRDALNPDDAPALGREDG